MIDRIVSFSVRHRHLVLVIAAAAAFAGWRSMTRLGLDALPHLGDTQVVIRSTWDRSPDLVDSQVTYPIVSGLLGTPGVRAVRGQSDFGASFVYVIFDDETDLYWARSRTLEYLTAILPRLPEGVRTELGPDATSLGWVFQYVLTDVSGTHSLADLRSYQDWYLDYYLSAVPGVAEVASVGGFVKQYQVSVDPNRLRANRLSIQRVVDALKGGNRDVGGRVIESGGHELVVRGLGYAKSASDLGEILVTQTEGGAPIRIRDVARVAIGSEFRRGVIDLDGKGEAVSGVVIMREGQNALEVIDRVKRRIRDIQPSLPRGMEITAVYDRSALIHRAIDTSIWTIVEVTITVAAVILFFLWHLPSAAVPVIAIPLTALIAFIPLRSFGVSANIMSLGGLAIAIGALVDASIVMVEQTHRRLEEWSATGRHADARTLILEAVQQVARPSFFALLVMAVSFLPVLGLEAEEGRLFAPLAYAKTLCMTIAAVLSITLAPALLALMVRVNRVSFKTSWASRLANAVAVGTIHPEQAHPVTRRLVARYGSVIAWAIDRKLVVAAALLVTALATIPVWTRLGTEFVPPFDEGTLLFMPTTAPGISVSEAQRLLQITDRRLSQFPEVQRVLGKAGRAETATDPAPLSMFETLVTLRSQDEWRARPTWYSRWTPEWIRPLFRRMTSDRISQEELVAELAEAVRLPGLSGAWTMPIRGRLDMLSTGIRTPLGIKISGEDVLQTQQLGERVATILGRVPGTRSVFAERAGEGSFVDIAWDRTSLARHGLTIDDAQASVQYAIGGEHVTTAVQGRERYSINVRYLQDFRADPAALGQVLVATERGDRQVPVGELAKVSTTIGPAMLRSEDGLLVTYVYIDIEGRDLEGYVEEADRLIAQQLTLPPKYSFSWSGQYEALARTRSRLTEIIPLTLIVIVVLLYLSTGSIARTSIVLLAVPFSLIGAVWLLYLLDYQLSVAVWVGIIALIGVDAETGVFMLLYLDQAFEREKQLGRMNTDADLRRAIMDGAARRLRPKLMTIATLLFGLLPIMLSTGTGADVMKRIAAPMVGGILTSFPLELLVYPLVYHAWKRRSEAALRPQIVT